MAAFKMQIRYKTYPGNTVATELSRQQAVGGGKISVPVAFVIALGGFALVAQSIGHNSNAAIMAGFIAALALAICSAVLIETWRADSYKLRIAQALNTPPEKYPRRVFPLALVICGVVAALLCGIAVFLNIRYSSGMEHAGEMLRAGDYEGATRAYEALDSDEAEKAARDARREWGAQLTEAGQYDEALAVLEELGYADNRDLIDAARNGRDYAAAKQLLAEEKYEEAIEALDELAADHYADAQKQLNEAIYRYAGKLSEAGSLEEAISQLDRIGDYKDAAALRKDCAYRLATELIEQEEYDRAAEVLANYDDSEGLAELTAQVNGERARAMAEAGDYRAAYDLMQELPEDDPVRAELMETCSDAFRTLEANMERIGTEITLGCWDRGNGPELIRWRVLDITAPDEALVASVEILDARPYDEDGGTGKVFWKDSDIRAWLNGEFLQKAFSTGERENVLETERFPGGDQRAVDKVFLLTNGEVRSYQFEDDEETLARSLFESADWWTSNESGTRTFVMVLARQSEAVSASGDVASFGDVKGIRPAMRVRLEAEEGDR